MDEDKYYEPEEIACDRHGPSYTTFICGHLVKGHALGFCEANDPGNPRPDAWCNECERVLMDEEKGQWNDRSEAFADIHVVCANCYDEVRRRNVLWREMKPRDWELESALDIHLAHPDTFHIPPLELRQGLEAGDHAKLIFDLPQPDSEYYQGERM